MSSGIETPPLPLAPDAGKPPVPPPTPSELLIEERLRQTRRQVKGVDIITGLMTLLVCGSIYLFAAALADHWFFTGGLGFWGRLILWTILLAAGGVYFVLKVWPAIVYRINPIYAAETIEKSKPSLKNSLINFLLLRGRDREVAPVVYRAMEQRAAADLNQIEIDLAVDRHAILRWLYILLAVFVVFVLYLFISPKNPLVSAGRVLWPWANVQPPTRVTIDDSISPGDTTKFNGDTMTVSAEVHGLKEGEPVLVHYSTADKQILDQTLPLTLEKGKYRHEGQLPPGNMGFQQDCTYFLSAGDCRTRPFNVTVKIPPTIVVDRLNYHYPKYTGLPDRSVSRQGDIRAIEGTTVDVVAVANMPIQRANLDLNCLNRFTPPMDVKDKTATGHITLKLNTDGSMKPEYDSYQVIFTDMDRRGNLRPIRHRIDVTPDQPPEVKILDPESEKVSIAADGKLELRVQASDPDFALRRVAIAAECDGRKLDLTPILDLKAPTPPKTGQFVGQFVFEPSKLGLKGGERVEYWAEADDNKEPTANRSTTAKKLIEILRPENRQQNDRQPRLADKNSRPGGKGDKNEKKNDRDKQPPENRPNDENNPQKDDNKDAAQNNPEQKQQEKGPRNKEDRKQQDEPSQANEENRQDLPPEGDQGDASQKPGGEGNANDGNQKGGKQDDQPEKNTEPPEQENRKINPDAQEGDAFQKILDDANKQKKPNQPDQENKQNADRPENKNPNDQQASGDENKSGDDQSGKNNSGEKNKTGEKNSGEKNAEQKDDRNTEKSDKQKTGTDQANGGKSDDQKNNQKQTGEKADQGNKSDNKQSDPNKTGEKPTADKRLGENKSDEKNSGDKNANQKDSGQNKDGAGKSDKKQSGGKSDDKKNNDKAGGGKQGGKGSSDQQNKADENAQGNNPSGESQSGDKNSGQKENGKKENGANKSDKNQPDGGKPDGGKPDEKNSGDKSTSENPIGEKNADANQNSENAQGKKTSDKNAGDKNSAQKGFAQKNKNDADKSGQNAQAGDKSDDQKTGDKVSEDNKSDQKPSDMNKTAEGASGKKNSTEKNSTEKNSAEKNDGDHKPPTENASEKGTDNQKSTDKSQGNSQPAGRDKLNDPQEKAGAGKPSTDKGPSPESQAENKANKNVKPGSDPSKSDEEKSDQAQSPSQSENKSDSQGDNGGDKSGGAEKGGGQKSNQAGKGSAGTQTPSDDNGGKTSEEKGQGEIGNTPGKDAQSNKPDGTGEKRKSDSGKPSNDLGDGSKSSDENSPNGQPSQQQPDGGKGDNPSQNEPGGQASGNPTGGGKSNTGPDGPGAPAVETGGDEVNMEYARKQTELALRHLEDEMSKDKSELLDKLGWTKEDAKRFLERWQQLRRDARMAGPKGDEAKKNLEDALKSLGLRPTTTKIRHGSTSRDRDRGLYDANRSAPPADWAEQFQQYQRSMAEEKK